MICNNCGNELPNDSIFCEYCGCKLVENNINIQQNNPESEVIAPQNIAKNKKKIKLSKKGIIISAMALVVVGIVVVIILKQPGNLLSPQRKIIDEYFDAINDKDIEDIYEIAYTDEMIEFLYDGDDSFNGMANDELRFFAGDNNGIMGFRRGYYYGVGEKYDCFADSYPDASDGLSEEEITEKTLDMLEVSYDIVDIKPLDEVNLTYNYRCNLVNFDMDCLKERLNFTKMVDDDTVSKEFGHKVDDVYVAKVEVSWKYDDMLYGVDKKWWKDKEAKEYITNMGYPTYEDGLRHFSHFFDEFKAYHFLVLYQIDDEWYIYKANYLYGSKGYILDNGDWCFLGW